MHEQKAKKSPRRQSMGTKRPEAPLGRTPVSHPGIPGGNASEGRLSVGR